MYSPASLIRHKDSYFIALISLLLPAWNIPHTMGVRYLISLSILIGCMFIYKKFSFLGMKLLIPAVIWIIYLIAFPLLIADDRWIALSSFKSEWSKSIIFIIVGLVTGYTLRNTKYELALLFGVASAIPLVIHLIAISNEFFITGNFPWGSWGIHKHHADLGYTAIHTVALTTAYLLYKKINISKVAICLIVLSIAIVSPFIAKSRAGIFFSFFTFATVVIFYLYNNQSTNKKHLLTGSALLITGLISLIIISKTIDPSRWDGFADRITIGLTGDTIEINCQGVEVLKKHYVSQGKTLSPETEIIINSVDQGDGSRTVTARAGLALLEIYPWGVDGSKYSYQRAISSICPEPKIHMSHTHNAWIDTALAIGILGAIIYLGLLIFYAQYAIRSSKTNNVSIKMWSCILFSLCFVWGIRGLTDSVQRDQMLEMQSFLIFFALGRIIGLKKCAA